MGDTLVVVLGTRPEIVKLAPVIGRLGSRATVIHTGQHYQRDLSDDFFEAFGLEVPRTSVAIGGHTRGAQIGMATAALDELLADISPVAVLAQGDTNSTLAASLAANANGIPLVHVEAGLRSFDRRMPEEHNRVLSDHLADLCLAPTEVSAANLAAEAIPTERVVVTGNTIVDAVRHLIPETVDLDTYDVEPERYVLSTFHRPENVDDRDRLKLILRQLEAVGVPVLLPLHPRTRARMESWGVHVSPARVRLLEPLGYPEFLGLMSRAALVIADSGGVQEEVSILKRPMVVVRNSTERPEVLGTFCELVSPGNQIAQAAHRVLADLGERLERLAGLPSPYGEGDAAKRSMTAIESLLESSPRG